MDRIFEGQTEYTDKDGFSYKELAYECEKLYEDHKEHFNSLRAVYREACERWTLKGERYPADGKMIWQQLENNKGKKASDKSRIGMDMAVKLWRKNQPSAKAKKRDIQVAKQSKVVIPTTPTETKYYYGKRDYSGASDKYITESGEMGVESPLMRKRGYKMPGFGKRK